MDFAPDGNIEREEVFRALFEHTDDPVLVFDVGTRQIRSANPAAKKLFGGSIEPIQGVSLDELASDGQSPWEPGISFRRGVSLQTSHATRWFDLRFLPCEAAAGECVVMVGRDVTEEREDADAAAAAELDFRRSQKLDALGRLAGGIAHDFNNILSVILNYAALAMREVDEPTVVQDLQEIERAATRAVRLTKRLLVLGRRDLSKSARLDVSEHLRTIHPLLQKTLGANVRLGISAPEVPDIPVQADLFEELLVNLATNAHDALQGQDAQNVQIAASKVGEAEALELGLEEQSWVRLRFKDSGHGIKSELQEQVFEPFFSTKPAAEGGGLGLAMVESIVSGCGGHIRLESDRHGTQFDLYFPAVGESTPADHSEQADEDADSAAPLTLLLVDDEAEVRRSLTRLLELKKHTVIGASSGAEALAVWEERADDIDLLISDVLMPGMTGLELARRVRADTPGLRVLYVSGYSDSVIPLDELKRGVTDILLKPFTADALTSAIKALVEPDAD